MAINVLPKTKTPKGEHAMRTRRVLYPETSEMYICELDQCPLCGEQLELSRYSSGHKIVQNLSSTVEVIGPSSATTRAASITSESGGPPNGSKLLQCIAVMVLTSLQRSDGNDRPADVLLKIFTRI